MPRSQKNYQIWNACVCSYRHEKEAEPMTTLDYYSQNAAAFSEDTVSVDFTTTQNRFLKYLTPGAAILDFGCGSGRDAKYFAELGYKVTATDGCEELVKLASEYSGLPVKHLLFNNLADVEAYDGVWVCASILHLSKDELIDVLKKITVALKSGGYLYTSFKYGDFEGERHGRYFTDMTETSFNELLSKVHGLEIVEKWITGDVRAGRGDELWLNLVLKKE